MNVSNRSLFDTTADSQMRARKPPRAVGVMAALNTLFSLFSLNVVFVLTALPLITLPVAFQSALIAVERWRANDEDRMAREFLRAFRAQPKRRPTVTLGVPIAAVVAALLEIRFSVHVGGATGAICAGLGAVGLLLALAGFGYLAVLGVRRPNLRPTDAWYAAIVLVITNLFGASAALVAASIAVCLLEIRDPALTVIGVPLALVAIVRIGAARGIRNTERRVPGAVEFFNNLEVNK